MKVLKFGGSSLSTPERMRDVARIVLSASKKERVAVIVSAFQGITNQLLESARLAAAGNPAHRSVLRQIEHRHRDTLKKLRGGRVDRRTSQILDGWFRELRDLLHGIYLLRDCPPRAFDVAGSFGERMSALILASYLNRTHRAEFVDARGLVVTDDQFTQASVIFDRTNAAIRAHFKKLRPKSVIPVVTGFIGSTEDGRTTTIGRNGSDYSAAIFGAALGASVIEIWTDVDGIYSADPGVVPTAFVVPNISYEEAMELSYFGAKVLHSATIGPAVAKNIPILIKNTMNPAAPGSFVTKRPKEDDRVAKGITSVDGISLMTLRGISMVGVPGTAERLFRALASHQVNVILISQASSEHTICFAIKASDGATASRAIAHEFRYEFQHSLTSLDHKKGQTIVAIIGDGMKGVPGISGKVFQSLGQNNININAIAQGASERNISFVIDSVQGVRAVNVIHQAFFEKRKQLSLFVVGVGNIGSALLRQVRQQRPFLLKKGFDLRVCGIANSRHLLLKQNGLDLERWEEALQRAKERFDPLDAAQRIADLEMVNVALVDCTASSDLVDAYPDFVRANMHVITPNKKANVLPWKQYTTLVDLLQQRQKHFLYEANVGAGLPVISTLQDLVASGDTIVRIDGILSGTLSYLFNTYDGSGSFSALVRKALERGFTEPDPREDLSGKDVARKLLILARQLGFKVELKEIQVENLVPPPLRKGSFSEKFFERYTRFDRLLERRVKRAKANGAVVRYVGTLEGGIASAGLKEIPAHHPLAATKGSDNVIAFTTHRYSQTPLVVQGPGAGADVTAMGVFSDILKLLHYLPY
ncbi:MAG TPA: bifunctional aspartate kinase/homoserine dehydrogenase I [Bacteroidota bacterium]|jgi:aspartokinase/homoserine dehydrogenase 1